MFKKKKKEVHRKFLPVVNVLLILSAKFVNKNLKHFLVLMLS